MKAVVFRTHGGPEVLEVASIPTPEPGPGEVLIQVKACALNHLDIWVRMGLGAQIPMPHISGSDVSGVVAAVGSGVADLKEGTRVIIAPGQTSGAHDHLYPAQDSACPDFQIFGFQTQGGYAEYALTQARHVIPVSDRFSFEQWAAIPLTYLTAYHMLFTCGGVQAGQSVVVHGCGSGLGLAAIHLAKIAGARVVTTSRSADKLMRAKRVLGVDETINLSSDQYVDTVLAWTGGRGADVVIDHVGPALFDDAMKALRRGGRLVNAGATTGKSVSVELRALYGRNISIHGAYMGSRWELDRVLTLAEQQRFTPIVDSTFPLEEARAAQQRMEEGGHFGKIVLTV